MGDCFATIDTGRGLRMQAAVPASANRIRGCPVHYGAKAKPCTTLPTQLPLSGPHLTQCYLGRDLASVPSGILIHPTVWP